MPSLQTLDQTSANNIPNRQSRIFASGEQKRAVGVKCHRRNCTLMGLPFYHRLRLSNIQKPDLPILKAQAQNIPICIVPRGFGAFQNYRVLSGNNLYASSTTWNVGIGTTNPGAKLEINATGVSGPGGWLKGIHFTSPYSAITIKNPDAGKGGLLFGLHALNQKFYFGHYNPDDSWDKYMMVIDAISGNVGIGTDNPQAKLEVAGAIRLTPSSQPSNPQEGMMYYDRNQGKFKCYVKVNTNPVVYDWQDCGGGEAHPTAELTVPVKIWDSPNKTRLVLEITEE